MAFDVDSALHQTDGVKCSGKERLLQSDEGAIRRWAHVQGSFELIGHMREETRKAAQADYIAAKSRLTMHNENCSQCSRDTDFSS
jgi:hypothetical protein